MTDEYIPFHHEHPLHGQPGQRAFFTRDSVLPAADLVGRTVTLAGKDGQVYDKTVVTACDGRTLTLNGGRIAWPYQPYWEPTPITEVSVPTWEIARGRLFPDQQEDTTS
ncbi:hypothetical protein ACFY05_32200 [Microtetraspora fusca]|uniref:Uncharacterized protein n=1 Tax=Microtetraspora fusca TaxID=1997 RepID=A0ABW6VDV8_MICFU